MAGGRGPCERETPRGGLWVWVLIVYQMITNGKAGATGTRVATVRRGLGAGTAWIAGRPLARAGVHRVLGQVSSFCPDVSRFSAKCVHFSGQITPNVSTRTGNVSTLSLDGGLEPAGAKALVLALQGRLCDRWRGCAEDPSPCPLPQERGLRLAMT